MTEEEKIISGLSHQSDQSVSVGCLKCGCPVNTAHYNGCSELQNSIEEILGDKWSIGLELKLLRYFHFKISQSKRQAFDEGYKKGKAENLMALDKAEEEKIKDNSLKEEWGGWRIVSDMFDNPYENGIYRTSKCYQKLYEFVIVQKEKAKRQARKEVLNQIGKQIKNYRHTHAGLTALTAAWIKVKNKLTDIDK